MKKWIALIIILLFVLVFTWPSNGATTGRTLLKEGQVERIFVTSYTPGGNHNYTFTEEDIGPIIDYIAKLPLIPDSSPYYISYFGVAYGISLEYTNGDVLTIIHSCNSFVRTQDGPWYRIDYGKNPPSFSNLLYELNSK